ncbi:hypothetical protein J6590_035574 [Homalodisca vitripennis]|nr:hypothetical protein J6590_035574 [Homalodisca vitripennis]
MLEEKWGDNKRQEWVDEDWRLEPNHPLERRRWSDATMRRAPQNLCPAPYPLCTLARSSRASTSTFQIPSLLKFGGIERSDSLGKTGSRDLEQKWFFHVKQ